MKCFDESDFIAQEVWDSIKIKDEKMKKIEIEIEDDEILVAIKKGEGYEDVCAEIVIDDAMLDRCPFEWRLIEID